MNNIFKNRKDPWQISAARYCVENSEKGFEEKDLKSFVQLHYSVSDGHMSQFIQEELQFPLGSKFSRTGRGGYWIPPLELVSKVTDYDELKEARGNSVKAFVLSMIAIGISVAIGLVQLLKIQDVMMVNEFIKTEIVNIDKLNR